MDPKLRSKLVSGALAALAIVVGMTAAWLLVGWLLPAGNARRLAGIVIYAAGAWAGFRLGRQLRPAEPPV